MDVAAVRPEPRQQQKADRRDPERGRQWSPDAVAVDQVPGGV